jgi:xanthine/CO dehydrogenase XdhC/CoxF family maturation factor
MNCANEFARLYASVCALEQLNFASPAALATITRTAGSTFRHAGSRMLVHADGEVVCALSGGCPHRDIVERAKSVISEGRAQLARYNRESSFDVLMEMGCGGELEILIEPLSDSQDTRFLHVIAQMHERREPGFMATVFARNGVAVRPLRLVNGSNQMWSAFEDVQMSQRLVALGVGADLHFSASTQYMQDANGSLDVLIERLQLPQVLILIGINAVSLALAEFAAALGWRGVLVDHRTGSDIPTELPGGISVMHASPNDLLGRIPADAHCAALVMTFDVEHDLAYLRALAQAPMGYLGAIGSRARAARMRTAVAGGKIPLNAPAGLDLGAENPQEIALAIAAEILAHCNERSVGSLSAQAQ